MKKRYYLAYGSNLNVRQMGMRCPSARIVGTATLEGYRLMFKGSNSGAYLTIEREEGCTVPVGVWEVTSHDEHSLDRYEGFPAFYYKKEVELPVTGLRTGYVRKIKAFVYIMHEERRLGIPSSMYMRTCMEGYAYFGLNPDFLWNAYEYSERGALK